MRARAGVRVLLRCSLALAAGCGRVDPERNPVEARNSPAGTASAPCTAAAAAETGTFRRALTIGGERREFLLRVPSGYRPTDRTPLVLNLHGGGGTAQIQAELSRFDATADARGVLVAYPEGTQALVGRGRYWNAGECCGRAERREVDDVAFLAAVVDEVAAAYCVDPGRVYATGMSNGGMMAYRLACERADLVAAVAAVAGVMVLERCAPARPVSVLHIHGTADPVVPLGGGEYLGTRFDPVERTIQRWIEQDRCPSAPSAPAAERAAGVACERHAPCAAGTEVRLCLIEGGGHTWPGGRPRMLGGATRTDVAANELIWEFFATHPRPVP